MTRLYWQGSFFASTSLAIVNCRLVRALIERGNLDIAIGTDPFARTKLTADQRFFTERMTFGPQQADIVLSHEWPPHFAAPASARYVHYQPWEYGSMPRAWFEALHDDCDDLWSPSSFNRDAYRDAGFDLERLFVIPHGVDTKVFQPEPAGGHDGRFRFVFVGGTIFRKGIDLLIDAYARAFRGVRDVVLTIKDVNAKTVYRGQNAGDQLRALMRDPHIPPLEYIDDTIDDAGLAALLRGADCLVHPYRGEAFALPVLEAMACGLPVIVTAGGATDGFVDEAVGWRVPSLRRDLTASEVPFATVTTPWLLEPDAGALARVMRAAYDGRSPSREKGRAGAERARVWSWERAAGLVEDRIAELLQRAPLPARRRDERFRDATLYAEHIYSSGDLDGIVIELFKRLRVNDPVFVSLADERLPTLARFLESGLGWKRVDGKAGAAVDMLVLDDVAASTVRARAIATRGTVKVEGFTCIALERTSGESLFVRDDLLAESGFLSTKLIAR